jgi:hypothetical protein
MLGGRTREDAVLEMRERCERCGAALAARDDVSICVFECTYCRACTDALGAVCTNCGGELVRRPRPAAAEAGAAAAG